MSSRVHNAFAQAWFASPACQNLTWFGVPILKNPLDLFLYQELLSEVHPDYIVETGAHRGGSTLFFAHMTQLLGHGHVISIDSEGAWDSQVARHPNITCVLGNSVDPNILSHISSHIPENSSCFVILDSDHSEEHVLAELRSYSKFVLKSHYLVVEDTIINHPCPLGGPGPWEAVDTFLGETPGWELTENCSRLGFSLANHGFLQRTT